MGLPWPNELATVSELDSSVTFFFSLRSSVQPQFCSIQTRLNRQAYHTTTTRSNSKDGKVDQTWFKMEDLRRRNLSRSVWIPLRSMKTDEVGKIGHLGYRSEFFGVGTIAISVNDRASASELRWSDIGVGHTHFGCVEKDTYVAADTYEDHRHTVRGLHLVLDQDGDGIHPSIWHLHQDLIVTLGLRREGDVWTRPREGYIDVARLRKLADGTPYLLEIRASHIRDYLCARGMALYVTSFRSRVEIMDTRSHITWTESESAYQRCGTIWKGRVTEIHEGGMPFGSQTLVIHVERTDVDPEEDVPQFDGPPNDENVISQSRSFRRQGRKLYRIEGELWRTEWIEPAVYSPIVRHDEVPPTVYFISDAEGRTENRTTLQHGRRWLWFRPELMCALAHRRGGRLTWYTRDTGGVGFSPGSVVHFGLNPLGLVNVYAKDIALLDEWEQRIWSGYNVGPDGGVSKELMDAQVRGVPAETKAPEAFLETTLLHFNRVSDALFGEQLLREHDYVSDLITRAHRFRVTSREGLFSLSKDLTRLFVDRLDVTLIRKLTSAPNGLGSLKLLEKLVAMDVQEELAREVVGPLVGIYELRHGDAHLPSAEYANAMNLVEIDQEAPYVAQGYQLMHGFMSALSTICQVVKHWQESKTRH